MEEIRSDEGARRRLHRGLRLTRLTLAASLSVAAVVTTAVLAPRPAQAMTPGANGAIAFSVGAPLVQQEKNLFEINPDGSGAAQISGTAGIVNDLAPVFSPDGNRVAFADCLGGCGAEVSVVVANADGSGRHVVTTSTDGVATWSPDGTQLAVVDQVPELGIYVVNADGTNRHLLMSGTVGGTGSPSWSPDGSRIAFFDDFGAGVNGGQGLWLVDVAGAVADPARRHLLLSQGTGLGGCTQIAGYTFDWSPDGTKLVYHCVQSDGLGGVNQDIAAVDAATGLTTPIVATPGTLLTGAGIEWFPRWSPDGTHIVYEREGQVWTATSAGADQHVVAPAGFRPSWQPCVAATLRCGPAAVAGPAPGGGPPSGPAPTGASPTGASPTGASPVGGGGTCTAAAPSGCRPNAFRIGTSTPTRNGTVVRLTLPGAGTVSIAATKRTKAVRKTTRVAGLVKLVVQPTAAGRKALAAGRSIVQPVTVTFRPVGGLPRTQKARFKLIR